MRNRAKCKLCNAIIESMNEHDHVVCKCGHIAVSGGPDKPKALARDFANFLRVDDEGNEKAVVFKEKEDGEPKKMTTEEILRALEDLIKSYENLPQHALLAPVSHADQLSLLMIVSSLFRSIC